MLVTSTIGRSAVRVGLTGAILGLLAMPQAALAQRVLLDEDFEGDLPDTLPASIDTFNRSVVIEDDPADAFVTGGTIPDPFDPGNNQSLVLYNPNNAAQEAVNWFTIFPDDVTDPNYYLRNGVIEFDVYVETLQPDGYFGFMGIRFGFASDPEDRNQVTIESDQTIWNTLRFYEGGLTTGGNILFEQSTTDSYSNELLLAFEQPVRVRYDINGTSSTYTVSLDNPDDNEDPVEIVWPGSGSSQVEWYEYLNPFTLMYETAPGINEITFITDASARSAGAMSAPNVYIDNLLIIDNDQEPGPAFEADFDGDGDVDGDDFLRWQTGFPTTSGAAKIDGDYDNDGDVDGDDFLGWQTQFPSPGRGQGAGAVPEPTGWALLFGLVAGGLALLRSRLSA